MFQPIINGDAFTGVQPNYVTPTGYASFRSNGPETNGGSRYAPQGWGPIQSIRRSTGTNAFMDPNQMGFLNTQAPQHEADAVASGLYRFGLPFAVAKGVRGSPMQLPSSRPTRGVEGYLPLLEGFSNQLYPRSVGLGSRSGLTSSREGWRG